MGNSNQMRLLVLASTTGEDQGDANGDTEGDSTGDTEGEGSPPEEGQQIAGLELPETCGDGLDNNNNGQIDEGCEPEPTTQTLPSGPGVPETCGDGIDNNGEGQIDEGCVSDVIKKGPLEVPEDGGLPPTDTNEIPPDVLKGPLEVPEDGGLPPTDTNENPT